MKRTPPPSANMLHEAGAGGLDVATAVTWSLPPSPPGWHWPLLSVNGPAPRSELTTPMWYEAGLPMAAKLSSALMSCGKRLRSSACLGAIDGELSMTNKRSTLFFKFCSTRTLVSCVTVVFGDSTGGARQANNGISPMGATSRASFQVRERIRNLRERRILE